MCGFAGAWEREGGNPGEPLARRIQAMIDPIHHRGPDDQGLWADPDQGVGLGFRRLAILDLSPAGHQPMESQGGRFVITFNGEIYNCEEIRAELAALGHAFRGHSDTEVMLAAFREWGVEASVPRFWGMFAFACWDREVRRLWLGRDRLGKKPLYYGWQGGSFLWGSELRALRRHPGFQGGVDQASLRLFLLRACVPSPRTIHPGLAQLPPGTLLSLDAGGTEPRLRRFWDPAEVMPRCAATPFSGDPAEAEDALLALLQDAVDRRCRADVPVGAFLSGGVDSSLVAALMAARGGGPISTYTIGFQDEAFDESAQAARVAGHLGTRHHAARLDPADLLELVPRLPELYDEPFADLSQLPTYLLCRWARREVVVALSGDGGDEAFAGYWRAFAGAPLLRRLEGVPAALRKPAAALLRATPPKAWDTLTRGVGLGGFTARHRLQGDRLAKAAAVLGAGDLAALHDRLLTHGDPDAWMLNPASAQADPWAGPLDAAHPSQWMALKDARTYLPDDVLVKVDRASMAVSLEARAPLLDHRVFEFAWTLPPGLLVANGQGKAILRRLLGRFLPEDLQQGPKRGFEVPLGPWLRGPLRPWAEELLSPAALADGGFRAKPLRALWARHLAGGRDLSDVLWPLLVYQQWRGVWG